MTDKRAKKIEPASFLKIITKCRYNKNIHCGTQGGSKELGVAGLLPFLITIRVKRTDDIGKTLHVAMALIHYSTGISYPILSYSIQQQIYPM